MLPEHISVRAGDVYRNPGIKCIECGRRVQRGEKLQYVDNPRAEAPSAGIELVVTEEVGAAAACKRDNRIVIFCECRAVALGQ